VIQSGLSLGLHAFKGAVWTISTSVLSRALGVIGTLILTRFIAPAAYGDVAVAAVIIFSANQLSTLGVGQYVIAHPRAPREAIVHAVACHVVLGVLAFGTVVLLRDRLAPLVGAPGMAAFVPGLALAVFFDRVTYVPERLLIRDLRFRVVALAQMVGDLAYTATSVALAVAGWGGAAIVAGNLARSVTRMTVVLGAADRRAWLVPTALRARRLREMLTFSVPVSIGALAAVAARRWDTLLVSRFFGPGPAGVYSLAYNLAEIPAMHVGEHVGSVLLPLFAQMDPGRHAEVLARSLRLLGLVMFPLAVGLAAVAPTLVRAILDPAWQPVGLMLTVLAVFAAAGPIGSLVTIYLQSRRRPVAAMTLECFKLVAILGLIATVGRFDPLWVCIAVDLGFILHALAGLCVVARADGLPLGTMLRGLVGPLVACGPLVIAVAGVRAGAAALGWTSPSLLLVGETLAGAVAYGASILLVARESARDLAGLARRSLLARR
jgi:lipopolysaccharide exporter